MKAEGTRRTDVVEDDEAVELLHPGQEILVVS
jgi:hypothetical protein